MKAYILNLAALVGVVVLAHWLGHIINMVLR